MIEKAFLLSLFFSIHLGAQSTFNRQIDIPEFPFHVLTAVLPENDGFKAIGVITDTAGQDFAIGNIFVQFDLDGEMESFTTLGSPTKYYQTWFASLQPMQDERTMSTGIVGDTASRFVLLNYDINGDTLWTKEILNPLHPDPSFVYAAESIEGLDGNLYILGKVTASDFSNDRDVYLFKLDAEGNLLDIYSYGDGTAEAPHSMVLDSDGGLIIGSIKTNLGLVVNNFVARTHIFKVDEDGQKVWEYQTPATELFDIARDMVRTPDGGLVVATGKGIEHVVTSSNSQLRWHSYLFKLDADHQKEWGIELRGTRHSGSTGFVKVVESVDGYGYVATGNLLEDVSIGEQVFGSWVAKISPDGDSLWARYYSFFDSIETDPRPHDLKATPDGGYVIVGETKPELPDGQGQRAWIMKLDRHGCLIPDCHGGDTVIVSNSQPVDMPMKLAIYPNPTSDFLNFQLRTPETVHAARFRIVDASGRIVKEVESIRPKGTHIVPVTDWPDGVYFLQYLRDGRVQGSERFVIKGI